MSLFFAFLASAGLPAEPAPSVPTKAYRECVRKNGYAMEPAGEGVEFTVKAAFKACRNERANLVLSIEYWQNKMPKFTEDYKKKRLEMQLDMIEQPLDAALTSDLMLRRAQGSK